tara:strand:+ start:666 stop:1487 length:822 start_codon:yes stop_codon:yes gene_type:complete
MAFVPYMAAGFAVDKLMGGDGMKGALLGAGGSFLPGMLASGAGAAATTGAATAAAANTMPLLMTNSAALGGSGLGLGAGAMSTGLGTYSTALNPMAGMSPFASGSGPGVIGSVNPLTTGGFSESISPFTQLGVDGGIQGANTGFFGQEISKQGLDSALNPKLFNGALENTFVGDGLEYLGKGKDFIDSEWEDMSFTDQLTAGTTGMSAIDNATQQENMIVPPVRPIERRQLTPTKGKPLVTQIQGLQQAAPQNMTRQLRPEDEQKYYSMLRSI